MLAACGPARGLPRELAVRLAQAFGGGMGRTGGVCGGVTGAMMVIGLECSMKDPGDTQTKQEAYRLTREFMARFAAKNGSIYCRDLLGCDIGTEEGFRKAHEAELAKTICPPLVACAVEILEELLATKKGH